MLGLSTTDSMNFLHFFFALNAASCLFWGCFVSVQNFLARGLKNLRLYASPTRQTHNVPTPKAVSHAGWANYLQSEFDRPGFEILEVGSRVVTGARWRERFSTARYTGFDFYDGENVDVVGDAHRLSTYFDSKFDLIFSSAVFEHLYMPWVVAEEIQKLLKVGGCVFIETHFSYETHERPWNFFQFSDMGLQALFNRALGFEVLDVGMSNPMRGYFAADADEYLRFRPVKELYCHSEILCRKVREIEHFDWRACGPDDLVGETKYPEPGL